MFFCLASHGPGLTQVIHGDYSYGPAPAEAVGSGFSLSGFCVGVTINVLRR